VIREVGFLLDRIVLPSSIIITSQRNDFRGKTMLISVYDPCRDADKLMQLLEDEGDEWSCYWAPDVEQIYRQALSASITYVCYDGDLLCGYSRSLNDCGFYIYVCDLLVRSSHRGQNIGRQLMECLCEAYPDQTVFVMSDVDQYYQKQGYKREGSVFEVSGPGARDSESS